MQVSVIITTHNRALPLKRACESVLSQNRMPEELIIIDDASKIPVEKSLGYLANRQTNLKVYRFDISQGACKARNQGAKIASGDILMFLDDDDSWESTKISDQLAVFCANPEVGLVYSGKLMVKETARQQILYKVKPIAAGKIYPQILYDNLIGSTSSVALKKSLFEQVGGFDDQMPALQDYDLWIRCCQKTLVGHDRSYNLRYTISDNPQTQISGQCDRYIEASRLVLDKYSQEIAAQGILAARRIYAVQYFWVAKSLRLQGLKVAIPWIWASLVQYPNFKAIALVLPLSITQRLRKMMHI